MSEGESYEELLKKYRDLELRVTRFSSTQQELINTRDRLDYELILYKRLQDYNARALTILEENGFYQLLCEAMVDVFELEAGCIVVTSRYNQNIPRFFQEGVSSALTESSRIQTLIQFATKIRHGKIAALSHEDLLPTAGFSDFNQLLVSHVHDKELGYSVQICAGNSLANQQLYRAIEDWHLTIFGVFVQQVEAMVASRKRSLELGKQMSEVIRSQHELRKLSLIATKTRNGVIITNSKGIIEWVNDAFTDISGYSLEESMGKKPKELVQGPATEPEAAEKLKDALYHKKEVQTVITNYSKTGETYKVQLEIIPVFDELGNHTNFIALQRDITEEMRHEAFITNMNTRFQMIAQNSKTGIWEWRVSDNHVEWNEYMYSIYGLVKSDTLDLRSIWQSSIHGSNRSLILQNTTDLMEGRLQFVSDEYEIIRQSDQQVRILKSITIAERNQEGQLLRLVGSLQDITEERALIAERDASMQRVNTLRMFYESILNHSPEDIVVLNAQGELLYHNNSTHASSGWLQSDFKGSVFNAEEIQPRFVSIVKGIRTAIQDQTLVQLSDELPADDQAQFLYNILPYAYSEGQLEHIIVSTIDISELKRVQLSLERKNDELKKINLELDHFVYSVSHDLRSPLLSIKGIISLILSGTELDGKTKHLLNLADASASRLDNTIQEILEYSRNSRLHVEFGWMQIHDVLLSICDDMRFSVTEEIEFKLNFKENERIWTDGARLNIVLKNIVGNSIKYRKRGVKAIIECSLHKSAEAIELVIKDNGEGVAKEHMHRIFDMFYRATTSSTGTGLGLYICKEIMTKLNGHIRMESDLGVGTSVYIHIPNARPDVLS